MQYTDKAAKTGVFATLSYLVLWGNELIMEKREQFSSRLGFILVSAGCAIGLGNVWKFPYMCGQYGGGIFIAFYLLFLVIMGIPIIVSEFAMGRGSKSGIATAFTMLEPQGQTWHKFRWFCMAGSYILMMFYTVACGWMLYYAYMMITGQVTGISAEAIPLVFTDMLADPQTMVLWMTITIVFSFGVCAMGVQRGVERVSKWMMICLIILMVILAVNSVTLDGAMEGVRFFLVPDWEQVQTVGLDAVIFGALTQSFFTLGIGIGSMAIFGSYLDDKRSLTGEAVHIVLLDTFVAMTAGFIVIPACFAYGIEPNSGPPLLFITLTSVFNDMPFGRLWGSAFFVFMSFAALSTVITMFENQIAFGMDMLNWNRKKSVLTNLAAMLVLAMPAALGYNILSDIQPLGADSTILDFEDFIVSDNLLPIGGAVILLFCTSKHGWGFEHFLSEANRGTGLKFPAWVRLYMSYVLPVVLLVLYIRGFLSKISSLSADARLIWIALAAAYIGFTAWIVCKKRPKTTEQ